MEITVSTIFCSCFVNGLLSHRTLGETVCSSGIFLIVCSDCVGINYFKIVIMKLNSLTATDRSGFVLHELKPLLLAYCRRVPGEREVVHTGADATSIFI